jgi:HAD superfamily hydrolase (TIGR01509 family)
MQTEYVRCSAMEGSVVSPVNGNERIRAVLFDLDGTLYDQTRLRSLMALELMTMFMTGPARAVRRLRALATYRHAQEQLRAGGGVSNPAAAQIEAAADRSGLPVGEVQRLVDEWIMTRPLKYMRHCRRMGVLELLDGLVRSRVPIGIFSDYPASAKLAALGLAGRFDPVLCSTDPEIAALKPNPRGFLRACETWRVRPREVLVIGDRPEVDAVGARAAGMPCVIIGGRGSVGPGGADYFPVRSFERLRSVLHAGS